MGFSTNFRTFEYSESQTEIRQTVSTNVQKWGAGTVGWCFIRIVNSLWKLCGLTIAAQ